MVVIAFNGILKKSKACMFQEASISVKYVKLF